MSRKPINYYKSNAEEFIEYYIGVCKYFGVDYMRSRIDSYLRKPKTKTSCYKINQQYYIIKNSDQLELHHEAIRRYQLNESRIKNTKN